MAFELDKIVPWGRSLEEYAGMFSLGEKEMSLKILDCGGGPSSFNAEMTDMKRNVVSCDPLYGHSVDEIRGRINETYDTVLKETVKNKDGFVWTSIKDPDELGKIRMRAMSRFLDDLDKGKEAGRYVQACLPELPFGDNQFGLALSSHFLFLYSDILSLDFHVESIREMCRVAKEARIFPVLDLSRKESVHLTRVLKALDGMFSCEVVKVNYEFQKGGNKMLKVSARA